MKSIKLIFILSCISLLMACQPTPSTKVMTLNIRYDNPNDGDNWWDLRKSEVVELLKSQKADFIGLQEALPSQTIYIAQHLDTYKYVGVNRDGTDTNSEGAPIFYNSYKYKLLKTQTIWLSETPDTISRGWDAALNRIVVYGEFQDKENQETIHIFNAHYDHMGELARQKSSELLVNYIKEQNLSDEELVLIGDFNSQPSDAPIEILERSFLDSYKTQGVPIDGCVGTFNAFDTTIVATRRIDYIFTKNATVKSYRCLDSRRKNGLHVSDHFGLIVEL